MQHPSSSRHPGVASQASALHTAATGMFNVARSFLDNLAFPPSGKRRF